jgi:hypothetical protein
LRARRLTVRAQTIPGRGWFVYLHIYNPDEHAFGGTWQLTDFEPAV